MGRGGAAGTAETRRAPGQFQRSAQSGAGGGDDTRQQTPVNLDAGQRCFTNLGVFNLESGEQLVAFNDVGRNVSAVAFTWDGKVAAVGAHDGTVRLFDVEKKEYLPTPPGKKKDWQVVDKSIGALAFTPDDKSLLVGSSTGEVKLFNVAQREILHTLKGHKQKVQVAVFHREGKVCATAGMDNVVKLWDVASGKELRSWDMRQPYDENYGFVGQLAFTPDGRHLLSANSDTTLYMLELP